MRIVADDHSWATREMNALPKLPVPPVSRIVESERSSTLAILTEGSPAPCDPRQQSADLEHPLQRDPRPLGGVRIHREAVEDPTLDEVLHDPRQVREVEPVPIGTASGRDRGGTY